MVKILKTIVQLVLMAKHTILKPLLGNVQNVDFCASTPFTSAFLSLENEIIQVNTNEAKS